MRKIACITLDVESDFLDPSGRIRLFEDDALFNRYVNILKKNDVKITAFLVTSLISKHGDSYRRLQDQIPIEFAVHSHMHDMQNPCSRADIEEAFRTFRAFTGQNPSGYRAPVGQITREGLQTLFDLGFRYDSSIYPSYRPGRLGYNNLHLPVEPFRVRHEAQSIIEIPFATLHGVRLVFSLSYVKLFGLDNVQLADEKFFLRRIKWLCWRIRMIIISICWQTKSRQAKNPCYSAMQEARSTSSKK